jgi:hypothetical protein
MTLLGYKDPATIRDPAFTRGLACIRGPASTGGPASIKDPASIYFNCVLDPASGTKALSRFRQFTGIEIGKVRRSNAIETLVHKK